MAEVNRRIVLAERPVGVLKESDFRRDDRPIPELEAGEALLETVYLGIDAALRTWLTTAKSYFPPVEIGEVVRCAGYGVVVDSKCDRFHEGQLISGLTGWQDYSIIRDDGFSNELLPDAPMRTAGLLSGGASGTTAYVGLYEVGRPTEGETVVVSAAAGATGSAVGQLAKIAGCRAVGIAGGPEKCDWVVEQLGFDACIDYKADGWADALKEACPDRIDIYFDNVGGEILDRALGGLAMHGRVVLCGAISIYNEAHKPPGPSNYLNLITVEGRMEAFNSFAHWDRFPEITQKLLGWYQDDKLTAATTVIDGLDSAWEATNMLFSGGNRGKLLVQVNDDPTEDG